MAHVWVTIHAMKGIIPTVEVFSTLERAEDHKRDVAAELWDSDIPSYVAKPDNADQLSESYWDYMNRHRDEAMIIRMCHVNSRG
jgi:hypothetical protein